MKILQTKYLVRNGAFPDSTVMQQILGEIENAIYAIHWPPGSDKFTLYPEKYKNGVVPIKKGFLGSLLKDGWKLEKRVHMASRDKPG